MFNFCAQSAEELFKFVEDLKESIAEVSEMEQIRIECECPPKGGTFPSAIPGSALSAALQLRRTAAKTAGDPKKEQRCDECS